PHEEFLEVQAPLTLPGRIVVKVEREPRRLGRPERHHARVARRGAEAIAQQVCLGRDSGQRRALILRQLANHPRDRGNVRRLCRPENEHGPRACPEGPRRATFSAVAGPLRIVTYNVRYFGHALRGLASTRGSKRGVAEALATLDPMPDIVCLQEVETVSLRSSLVFRRSHEEETQLEAFMGELENAFEKRPPPFPYDAFYFRAHVSRIGNTPLQTMGLAILVHRYRIK